MQEFTNNPIEIDQLPKFEEVQLKGLHPKYINVLLFNFLLLFIEGSYKYFPVNSNDIDGTANTHFINVGLGFKF